MYFIKLVAILLSIYYVPIPMYIYMYIGRWVYIGLALSPQNRFLSESKCITKNRLKSKSSKIILGSL